MLAAMQVAPFTDAIARMLVVQLRGRSIPPCKRQCGVHL